MYIQRIASVHLLKRLHRDLVLSNRSSEMPQVILVFGYYGFFFQGVWEVYKTTLTKSAYLTGMLCLSLIRHCESGLALLCTVGPPQGLL